MPPFDIFRRQRGGYARWLGVTGDLEAAKLHIKQLAESMPGEYFVFSLATGQRLNIRPHDLNASSETKNELEISESQEGSHGKLRPDLQSMQ